jgi:hypothetical protein
MTPDIETIERRLIPALIASFATFGREILRVYDNNSNLVPLIPNKFQRVIYKEVSNLHRTFLLHKSRQLGCSTGIAAYLFFLCCFTPRYRVVVVANQFKNAEGLWKIYARFVEHMPAWLRDYLGVTAPHMHIRFAHGGFIDFYSSDSDGVRSQTYQAGHLSEVAHWPDPERAFAAVMGALSGSDPLIFFESTAKGMNIWHEMWQHTPAAKKLFFSWVEDRDLDGPALGNAQPPQHILELQDVWSLTPGQVRWATRKYWVDCHGSILLFRQEYPATAEDGFVASGSRVFTTQYTNIEPWQEGPMDWADGHPRRYTPYILGCDVAHGSINGDYSAICVLDATIKTHPVIVHTYYGHITPLNFAQLIHDTANRFKGSLVVVERNENGVSVIERMMQLEGQNYSMFSEMSVAQRGTVLKKILGWNTTQSSRQMLFNAVIEAVDSRGLTVPDPRLQAEINQLVWKAGRPDHGSKSFSDMIVALGLALNGMKQSGAAVRQTAIFEKTPRTIQEIMQWQTQTGMKVHANVEQFNDVTYDPSDVRLGTSVLGL